MQSKRIDVILSGRNGEELRKQSSQTKYPFEVVDIHDSGALCNYWRKDRWSFTQQVRFSLQQS